jgi:pyruvate carboxylase
MNSINFEEDKTDILDKSENIKSLSNEVQKMESLAKEIEDIEENLKQKKKDLDVISAEVIPTMMSEMGLSQLKLMDGSMIDVKPFYNATITVANRESAFNWLRQNGLGDIIKNEMVVSFGRGEDNKAAEYAELAKSQGLQPAQKLKVEPMTLKALVRQRIEAGQEMPTELFSIFVGNKTTIKRKK